MTFLLANAAIATLLAAIVYAVGRLARPQPAVMHGLWLLVVLKLVTPPLFEVPVDASWWRTAEPAAREASGANASPTTLATSPPRLGPDDVVTVHPLPPAAAAAAPPSGLETTLLVAWTCASMLVLLVTAAGALRGSRRLRALAPVPPWLRREVEQLAARMSLRVPELCDDPSAAGPYLWTLGRTRLVLPARLLQQQPERGRAAVLAHELAHLQRRDHWVARAEVLLTAALFWHPLYWFARARMRLWAELASDAVAVRTVPGASLEYASMLVDAAARPASPSTGPVTAVLAARPSARAAFERRLKMILNENLPRRASRAWLLPFAGLFAGLFALPVTAQDPKPRETVKVEIRVNGKKVEGLTGAQQKALLELLQQRDGQSRDRAAGRRRASERAGRIVDRSRRPGIRVDGSIGEEMRRGLAEARREIQKDQDLAELGITDEVVKMIDGIANGDGIEQHLDGVIKAAMEGAGDLVLDELENDPDLQKLGLDKGIANLVKGFLGNQHNQRMIGDLARTAIDSALSEARAEIRNDQDLARLGIAGDVEKLIDSVISGGGDFEGDLERVVERAMKAAIEPEGRSPRTRGKLRVGRKPQQPKAEQQPADRELRELERALEQANAELERAKARLDELRRQRRR
ncbi:MAG: M56 family metallopeptidase [Planctomycetota bacterium]